MEPRVSSEGILFLLFELMKVHNELSAEEFDARLNALDEMIDELMAQGE
jgi:hypothetical protein